MFNLHRFIVRTFGLSIYQSNICTSSTVAKAFTLKSQLNNEKSVNGSSENVLKATKNPLIKAAFDSLSSIEDESQKNDLIQESIVAAKTVSSLLLIAQNTPGFSRNHALQVVSILAEWVSINRVKLSDFESDARFIKLCKQLSNTSPNTEKAKSSDILKTAKISGFHTDDLKTVMSIAGDDEAAKLVATLTTPQMIKVMSSLALKKRRSTSLLRSLAYHISSDLNCLNLKQSADLLYAMAVLNFPDSVLFARLTTDIEHSLRENSDKPAVVGSILTSLGLLKFQSKELLECLTLWVLEHRNICRLQDISALFLTLATLNYPTTKSDEIQGTLIKSVKEKDFSKTSDWLNHVWALVILNYAESNHFESVLCNDFIERLAIDGQGTLSPSAKMKLLNINAATKLLPSYTGPVLADNSEIFSLSIEHPRNKLMLVNTLIDTLKSLFSSSKLLRTNQNTRMGFVIDVECVLDHRGNPLEVDKSHNNATKVAIMVRDFHDMCQGAYLQPTGISALSNKLLEREGYKILTIPYTEFSTSEKLLKRVQYLEGKIKQITAKQS